MSFFSGPLFWGILVVVALLLVTVLRARAEELLPEGTPVPAFSLPNQHGTMVSTGQLKGGWWVLYFYPKDDTPGCTKEACAFRDEMQGLTALGVRITGVSFDDVASHRAFAEKYHLNFDILADPGGKVISAYHARSMFPGLARRVSYLVDEAGVIRKVYPDVTPTRHAGEIIADVRALRGM